MIDPQYCPNCECTPCRVWVRDQTCGYCHGDLLYGTTNLCYCDGKGNDISFQQYHWRIIKAKVRNENDRYKYHNAIAKMH